MFPVHCVKGTEGSKIIDELEVKPSDKIICKRRDSAFYSTDLDLYLKLFIENVLNLKLSENEY